MLFNTVGSIVQQCHLIVNSQSLPIQDEPEVLRQFVYDGDMRLIINDGQLQTVEQVRGFLEGSEIVEFRGLTPQEKLTLTPKTVAP